MRSALAAVIAAVAVGCSTPPPVEPEAPRGTPKEARKEARALVEEAYRVLRDGDPVSLMGLLAPDLFFVGPGAGEVGLDRAAAIELASGVIDTRSKHKLRSLGLEIEAGPEGASAWAIDQIEYDGTSFAVTVIATQLDGLWAITAIEVARALPERRAEKLAAPAPWPELPRWEPPDAKIPAHGEAPRPLAKAFIAAAAEVETRLDQYGDQRDAAFVGPGPDQVRLGVKAIAKLWKKRAPAWAVEETIAASTPDGGLAWIVGHGALLDDGPPRRLFAIYRNDTGGDDGWQLAVLHESIAVR